MIGVSDYDFVIIGSGPAGQKAASAAAAEGKRVALVEGDNRAGGACVYRGTIPSKTLRENALQMARAAQSGGAVKTRIDHAAPMTQLMSRLQSVLDAHDELISKQIQGRDIDWVHGRARFVDPARIEVTAVDGSKKHLTASNFLIATGSQPRSPEDVVDHENILDSDSILSMCYLPQSMLVLGSGVIACEYASIFGLLGCRVTIVDRFPSPLGFLDPELSRRFVESFESFGGRFVGDAKVSELYFNGESAVVARLSNGEELTADKALYAQGREANVAALDLANAGLEINDRGLLDVNEFCQTAVPHIYAAGDVIGAPALASASMEQGRRAVLHAMALPPSHAASTIPAGIYTIPEISSVGLTQAQAEESAGGAIVACTDFGEVARGKIAGIQDGMLKLVCDAQGRKVLGCQIVGEGATELIHLAQMALVTDQDVDIFVQNIFNFPTLAEAYRIAALSIISERESTQLPSAATA